MDTGEIIATVAAGFAGASTLLAGWAAHTSHAARVWQRTATASASKPASG